MMLLVEEDHDCEKNTTFDDFSKSCPINVGSFWGSFAIVWGLVWDRSEVKKYTSETSKTTFFLSRGV